MRRGYKVVCNTAAGRHRYMNLLIPYVLDNDIVDRYDIWVNTLNPVDLRFFELLAQKYSKIKLKTINLVGSNLYLSFINIVQKKILYMSSWMMI